MVPGHPRVSELCGSPAPILPSPADKVGLQLDAVGVFTSLGLNERLFAVSVEELGGLVSWERVCMGWEVPGGNPRLVVLELGWASFCPVEHSCWRCSWPFSSRGVREEMGGICELR